MTSEHAEPRPRPAAVLRALRIPADPEAAASVVSLENRSARLSEAIGRGNLNEALQAPLCGLGGPAGRCCVYLDEDRLAKALPTNGRMGAVLALLGESAPERADDALVVGLGDADVHTSRQPPTLGAPHPARRQDSREDLTSHSTTTRPSGRSGWPRPDRGAPDACAP